MAMETRPELAQSRSKIAAADIAKKSAMFGPLLPSVTAEYGASRLRGGPDGFPTIEDGGTDTQLQLRWKIGAGGLLDLGRIGESNALSRQTELQDARLRDAIAREVVEAREAVMSAQDQMALAERSVENATRSLNLSRQRRDFGITGVLEAILAQQQLVAAQRAAGQAITQHNKAQYELARALGQID